MNWEDATGTTGSYLIEICEPLLTRHLRAKHDDKHMNDKHMNDKALRPLDQLERTILDRQAAPSENSYTSRLLAGGVEKIGGKIIEEAFECIEAAGDPDAGGREHTIYEAGDLMYHLMVLLAVRNIRFSEVEDELARRFGVSGIAEKASREDKS